MIKVAAADLVLGDRVGPMRLVVVEIKRQNDLVLRLVLADSQDGQYQAFVNVHHPYYVFVPGPARIAVAAREIIEAVRDYP